MAAADLTSDCIVLTDKYLTSVQLLFDTIREMWVRCLSVPSTLDKYQTVLPPLPDIKISGGSSGSVFFLFPFRSIPGSSEARGSALGRAQDSWMKTVLLPQRSGTVFALCFYWGWVKGCRVGLSDRVHPGCIFSVKEIAPACMFDFDPAEVHQVCVVRTLDSEPSWGSPFSLCRNVILCLDVGPIPALSVPPVVPPPVAPVTSAPVQANPKPCCYACTRQDLAESNSLSRSESQTRK